GIHLLAIGICVANWEPIRIGTLLTWLALAVLSAAAVLDGWRPQLQRFTRFELYTCGLLALGLILHGLDLTPPYWYWTATLLLAGHVLLWAALLRFFDPEATRWLTHVQLGSIALVLGMSLWITLTFADWYVRLGGPLA